MDRTRSSIPMEELRKVSCKTTSDIKNGIFGFQLMLKNQTDGKNKSTKTDEKLAYTKFYGQMELL